MPDQGYAAAYIRESSEDNERDLDAQKAGQIEDVRLIARRDGTDPDALRLFDDWGHSGSARATRPQQQQLLADVRAGRVRVIYARSLDRLMRSTQRLAELWALCGQTGTRIVTLREGDCSAEHIESNPSAWMFIQSVMTAAEYESRVARVRAQAGIATKRREGQQIGRYAYGDDPSRPSESVEPIMDAFAKRGTFLGAAKVLNAQGVPTRNGRPWDVTTVGRIVRRVTHTRSGHEGVFADPAGNITCPQCMRGARRGQNAAARQMFTGLLECACGAMLTSMPRKHSIGYYCPAAHRDESHPRPYVISERKIVRWAREQMAHMQRIVLERNVLPDAPAIQARLAQIDERRRRVIDMYENGLIDGNERDGRLARIRADRSRTEASLDVHESTLRLTAAVDWDAPPPIVNTQLRHFWTKVKMNGAMFPRRAYWVPTDEWGEDGPDI